MKTPLTFLILVFLLGTTFAAPPESVKGRRIQEVNLIPQRVLKRSISPKFYKTLMISPIDGWVVVRGKLSGTRVFGEKIVRSDLGGKFDEVALQVVRDIKIMGDYKLDSQIKTRSVLLHLLIYEIADGTMVLYSATLADAGGDQEDYFGSAKLAVLKKDGSWTEIKGQLASAMD
ncbi:MAG: hypothetical protein M3R07_12010 [Gemmatimonadota bacterium]|nr:hypothetical protein [Gemmatimonadota bacterium]